VRSTLYYRGTGGMYVYTVSKGYKCVRDLWKGRAFIPVDICISWPAAFEVIRKPTV